MKSIGITGGIGAGKSVVCRVFHAMNIPIYNADSSAKRLMLLDSDLRKSLQENFGLEIFPEYGTFDKKKLAALVFNDKSKLNLLNSLVHPAVKKDYSSWILKQNAPYCIREAAILFESGSIDGLDKTILVDAPESLRINRVIKRDNRTKDQIKSIINQQWTMEKLRSMVDFVIENDDQHPVIPQVLSIHHKIIYDHN
jgi:dephospho-CoA kinase